MSVRLCCWKRNEGVSGTDPGSSRVYPEETVREDEPNVPCSKIYPICEDYCFALKLQSPVAGKWSCVCIKAHAEAHVITVYFVSHHLTQASSSDSLSAHHLVTVLFCSLLYSMFFSHRDVIPSINFFYAYWQSCCVTTLTNCSSHREEPASPICAWDQTHSLCTLRFSHEAVSQPQPMQACPNIGCGSLFGKRIGSFAANQCVKAGSEFHCVWWLQPHPVTLHLFCFFVFSASDTHWVHTEMTGMMCHHRLGHCWRWL